MRFQLFETREGLPMKSEQTQHLQWEDGGRNFVSHHLTKFLTKIKIMS